MWYLLTKKRAAKMCIRDRPEAEPNAPYERRILYLSPEFLRRAGGSCDLAACFDRAREEFRFVVHPADGTGGAQLAALEAAEREDCLLYTSRCV